ncbi:PIG-L family deacetylase [Acidisoma cellulosilytica]|uniref:PIG-L family deacetylase n=1 Tax=Acidisoma cellulosilyticum TaxID=2802395 RepID=A0A963Z3Y7_9PROT|nr:PIG-L family deacetylase [Acidisoma cellulosilyticum]MCB8882026.1 PIG-L family deacetylase [Acidisoma cellulosilyticum]
MNHLYFSPHLDDVPLSCAGVISSQRAAGENVRMITLFTGDAPEPLSPLAQRYHAIWGRGDRPYVARREEDRQACALLGVDVHHEGLLEAIYRRGTDGEALYPTRADMFRTIDGRDDAIVDEIQARMLAQVQDFKADIVYAPLGLGRHADHQAVIAAARRLADSEALELRLYEEWPYAAGRFPKERPGRIAETLDFFQWHAEPSTTGIDIDHRLAVARCYASQIEELFDSDEAMVNELRAYTSGVGGRLPSERIWTVLR